MVVKLDTKALVLGIVLGAILVALLGANGQQGGLALGGAGKADFAIAIPDEGSAVVRTVDGYLYIVNEQRNRAELIVYESGRYKGRPLNINTPLKLEKGN